MARDFQLNEKSMKHSASTPRITNATGKAERAAKFGKMCLVKRNGEQGMQ